MYTNTKFGKSILPKVSGTNMCFWKAYCPIAGKIILIILVGNGRRFVYCVWLCFGNIMSVATINNVHSHKFQWNFFFWRKWVVVDNIILIKIFWVIPILSSKIDSKLLLADMIFGGFERSLVSENDFSNVFVNMS